MLKYYYANIHLLEEEAVFEAMLKKVNPQRREKVLRCKNKKDKQRSLMAGLLLRYGLETEGLSYEEIVFAKTAEGKPYMLSGESLHFSISHAGDYVGCLISDELVGLDMECLNKSVFRSERENHLTVMAKKCLSKTEWKIFEESAEKSNVFVEFWTKKEAYSKYTGKGLGMDFSHIETLENKDFYSFWATEEYCVSIYSKTGMYEDMLVEEVQTLYEFLDR